MSEIIETPIVDGIDNPFTAIGYIEGFSDEPATDEKILESYAYLIKTKVVWQLQGSYGRAANNLIENGYISNDGDILQYL